MAFNMMPMEPFDAASTANTAQRWKKWLNNFDLFVTAAAITDDKQKRATLLYSAGKGVQEIFATLDSTTTYKDAVDKLTAHFTPCANIPYSRHVFRQTSQQSSETTLMFVTRLRELAVDCDFGSDINGQIRDQVIERCVDKSLRVKYLTETNITLSKILKMSQAHETAHRHAEQYENNANVNFAQSKRVDRSQLKCFNCGSKGHFASNCRSRTKVNQKSNKSSRQPESEEARSSYNSGPNRHSSKRHKVRCVDDENVDVEESEVEHSSDEYCYAISNSSQKIIVMVNDQPVSMIIDSGASCNLITPEIADNLIRHGAKRVSKETKIWPYGSPPIVSTYYLDATVNFREVQTRAKLVVVDSNASSLMGKSTAEELGVLKIMVNALSNDELFSAYPNVVNKKLGKLKDCEVNFIANQSKPAAISMESLVKATEEDKLLQDVASLIKSNQWKQVHNNPKLQPYKNIHDELTIANNGILLRNARVIIPEKLQDQVITIAHEGHQGITKTKSLMRSKLWFPKMDDMVERYVNSCHECAMNTNTNNQVPLSMSELPDGPWMNISMDFCGPIPSGEYLFVIVDEYSRFPVVEIVNNLSAEKIIPVVDKVFSTFSYPVQVKTDNGTPFQSQQWSDFCEFNNIHHRSITPLWPKGNAQAENFNKPMLKAVRAAHHVRQSWKQALHTFLRMYRCTPHCTTSFSPHELLFTRPPRTKLPQIEKPDVNHDKVNQHDAKRKDIMKQYADTKNHAKPCDIVVGDKVYMKHKKINKWSTPYSSTIYNVVSIKGSMVTVCADDERDYKTRNVSFFKKVQTYTCRVVPKQQPPPPNNPAPIDQPQRPQRIKKPSVLLKDYVC